MILAVSITHTHCQHGGHFPVSIKFTDFSLIYYLARSGVAYFKVDHKYSASASKPENFWVYPLVGYKIPNLGYICYREGNLIVTENWKLL